MITYEVTPQRGRSSIQKDEGFMVTLFKDRFTEEQLRQLSLNDRQIKAVLYVKGKGRITSSEYQTLNEVSKKTATNDLSEIIILC
jgi:ATP-dependent DNA helicase RecG